MFGKVLFPEQSLFFLINITFGPLRNYFVRGFFFFFVILYPFLKHNTRKGFKIFIRKYSQFHVLFDTEYN